ncbi:unnamed protein product [Laminaria digitata]
MVDVRAKGCLHGACKKRPYFNIERNKTAAYCKQHALDGMVDAHHKCCSHNSCTKRSRWGLLADGAATVCVHHRTDFLDGLVINFEALCKVAGCREASRWGLDGKQPTHCRDHGPLKEGLVRTVGTACGSGGVPALSSRAVQGPFNRVKAECSF